jgi:hypothetical protein
MPTVLLLLQTPQKHPTIKHIPSQLPGDKRVTERAWQRLSPSQLSDTPALKPFGEIVQALLLARRGQSCTLRIERSHANGGLEQKPTVMALY